MSSSEPARLESAPPQRLQQPGWPSLLKDFIFSVSLGHLCLLRFWDEFQDNTFGYYWEQPPSFFLVFVALLTTLILAIAFFSTIQVVRRSGTPAVRQAAGWAFLALLVCVPLNTIRKRFLFLSVGDMAHRFGLVPVAIVGLMLAALGAYALWKHPSRVVAAARGFVWLLVPLLPVTLVQTALIHFKDTPADYRNEPSIPVIPNQAARVVWVIFDELDAGFVKNRPADIAMPEFDRLQGESLAAVAAHTPNGATIESIPSLLTGRQVVRAKPEGANKLRVGFADAADAADWKQVPNVFSEAHKAGWNSAISGWYHPYCRLFGAQTASCFWTSAAGVLHREESVGDLGVVKAVGVQLRRILLEIPLANRIEAFQPVAGIRDPDVRKQERAHVRQEYESIHEHGMRIAADPAMNIVYLHYPVPHLLAVFDRKTHDFATRDGINYFDNLLLVDRTIGDLRRTLERAGLWDSTTVIISADHPVRLSMFREERYFWDDETARIAAMQPVGTVPFLVKTAGQKAGAEYQRSFNTLLTKDLVSAIIGRKVTSASEAVAWLDANGSRYPIP